MQPRDFPSRLAVLVFKLWVHQQSKKSENILRKYINNWESNGKRLASEAQILAQEL